uniref:Putative lipocalin n=1 Tax=Ixodes ricinus TaxID=34613 RepID=V5GK19_IXORI
MYVQSLLVIFCLFICSYSQDTAHKPPLPEDDPKNFSDQNATKLVELSGTHWVKRRTYNVTTKSGEVTCEYAKILRTRWEKMYTPYNWETEIGSTWTSGNQTLFLEKSGNHYGTERAPILPD